MFLATSINIDDYLTICFSPKPLRKEITTPESINPLHFGVCRLSIIHRSRRFLRTPCTASNRDRDRAKRGKVGGSRVPAFRNVLWESRVFTESRRSLLRVLSDGNATAARYFKRRRFCRSRTSKIDLSRNVKKDTR